MNLRFFLQRISKDITKKMIRSSYQAIPSTIDDEKASTIDQDTTLTNTNESSLKKWAHYTQRGFTLIGVLSVSALVLGLVQFPFLSKGITTTINANVEMGLTTPDILTEPEPTSYSCGMSKEDPIKALEPTAAGMFNNHNNITELENSL